MSEEEKAELQEANDEIVWWHNRFNVVQRDYENLQQRIDKAIEYNNYLLEHCRYKLNDGHLKKMKKILGDKENVNK